MSQSHTIVQGEHLSQIAEDSGFRTFKTIWNDGDNAELAAKRDPHVLAVGDEVVIPDFAGKSIARTIDQSHRFVAVVQKLFLKVKLLEVDGTALAGAECKLAVDGSDGSSATTGGDATVQQRIQRKTQTGDIVAQPPSTPSDPEPDALDYGLKIGHLNPPHKMSGQQGRLNNMGYFAGAALDDLDQFLWAVEEFECDARKARVKTRPDLEPAPAQGEDGGGDDPDAVTGVTDGDLQELIRAKHGV